MKTAALAALLVLAAPAAAAERNFSVTSFDRIRVDGPYQVRLKTGVPPYARASGAQASLDGLTVRVEGRTMVVRAGSGSWGGYPGEGRGPVTLDIGTHELSSASLNGAGALTIDQIKGLSFDLSLNGAGSLRVDSADVDQLKVGLIGAGSARLAGRAGKLTASARGSASIEADRLAVKDAVIIAEGPALVRAGISGTAKVDAFGLASVVIDGGPSCIVKTQGSATVTGCQ